MLTPALPSLLSERPSTPSGQSCPATPDRVTDPGAGDADRVAWRMARAEVAVGRYADACARIAARLAPAAVPEVC